MVTFFCVSDASHKNSKYFDIDDESGKLTKITDATLYGATPVRIIATDRGEPSLNNTQPYQVNVYFLKPNEQINTTMALQQFEMEKEEGWLGAAMDDFGMYIIAAIVGIALICLIIIVVVIIK